MSYRGLPRHCQVNYGYPSRSIPATGYSATMLHCSISCCSLRTVSIRRSFVAVAITGGIMQPPCSEYANLDGYELFRRAIEERDEQAWAESIARYRRLLISWARRCIAKATLSECCEDIADYAFTRAWAALSPER